ncbi:MAG: hypothetical protein JEZ06_24095 [Anaerolineaceae bacterium]|nr:hypothetical protein [Anaerolineaceae bacterium]
MMLDIDQDMDIDFDGGGVGERVLSDLSFMIAFSMMIIVFIVIPYATYMSSLMVNLPDPPVSGMDNKTEVTIDIAVSGTQNNYTIVVGEGVPFSSPTSMLSAINREYEVELLGKRPVVFKVWGDKSLLYESIMDILTPLGQVSTGWGETRIELVYRPKSAD